MLPVISTPPFKKHCWAFHVLCLPDVFPLTGNNSETAIRHARLLLSSVIPLIGTATFTMILTFAPLLKPLPFWNQTFLLPLWVHKPCSILYWDMARRHVLRLPVHRCPSMKHDGQGTRQHLTGSRPPVSYRHWTGGSEPLAMVGVVCTLGCHPLTVLLHVTWLALCIPQENFHHCPFETSSMLIPGLGQEVSQNKVSCLKTSCALLRWKTFLILTVMYQKLDPVSLSSWLFPTLIPLLFLCLEKFLLKLSASVFPDTGSWIISPMCYHYLSSITLLSPWQDKAQISDLHGSYLSTSRTMSVHFRNLTSWHPSKTSCQVWHLLISSPKNLLENRKLERDFLPPIS